MSDKYKNKNICTIRCKTTILLYMYVQLHNHYLKDAVPIAKLFAWGEGDSGCSCTFMFMCLLLQYLCVFITAVPYKAVRVGGGVGRGNSGC